MFFLPQRWFHYLARSPVYTKGSSEEFLITVCMVLLYLSVCQVFFFTSSLEPLGLFQSSFFQSVSN